MGLCRVSLTCIGLCRRWRPLAGLALLALLAAAWLPVSAAPGDHRPANALIEIRYWDWTKTPKRDDYQMAALRLAMEKTRPDWGDYRLIRVAKPLSTPRARAEVFRGELVNVHVAPWRPLETELDKLNENNLRVNVGMFGGTFGCRSLLIRTEDRDKLRHIKTLDELRQLQGGVGRAWVDGRVMRDNHMPVVDSADVGSLLAMLAGGRFDYLPMSMLEVDTLFQEHHLSGSTLMASPDLMLYYPLPMIAYVSPTEPALAKRLEQGLQRARADGSLGRLTTEHFKDEIDRFKAQVPRVLVLQHPGLPAELAGEPALCQPGAARGKASR